MMVFSKNCLHSENLFKFEKFYGTNSSRKKSFKQIYHFIDRFDFVIIIMLAQFINRDYFFSLAK